MGEVYRARDPRLGRDVAIKVLPSDLASDAGRLKRFEKEARSASALNHPNIVTIYDLGTTDGVSWIAMERVEGKTLREVLFAGALPVKRVLQLCPQIADGLARAHEAGIVHRDLKPENVMVTKEGHVKILDFGLAKVTQIGLGSGEETNLPTETGTGAGVILGTIGYMSPEQASGQPVDFRSDQFSFGSILYELATGKRAFARPTGAQTLAAIIEQEPEPIGNLHPEISLSFRRIVERCLSKEPEGRYASTRDLFRDLTDLAARPPEPERREIPKRRFGRRGWTPLTAALAVALVLLGISLLPTRSRPPASAASSPRFRQVTFEEEAILRARFAPDGETFVYGSSRLGAHGERARGLFMARAGSPESRPLNLPDASICSISAGGQMAVLLGENYRLGTLAEIALSGGAPRELLENVRLADWSPDGKTLAVVHTVAGRDRLEFPVGKVLYESPASAQFASGSSIFGCRISPEGTSVAFVESGRLRLIDQGGRLSELSQDVGPGEFDWSPAGDEIWYAKSEGGATELHAVTPAGRGRFLVAVPGVFQLHDVSRNGRILLEKGTDQFRVVGHLGNDPEERDLGYRSATEPVDLSAEGGRFLFNEIEPGWTDVTVYVRDTGKPPVPLGRGFARALSPDGKWVIATPTFIASEMVLLPTGAGEPRRLPKGPLQTIGWANWLPDGRRIVFAANAAREESRIYAQDVASGLPRPITPPGVTLFPKDTGSFASPDGRFVVGWNPEGKAHLYPVEQGEPRAIQGLLPGESTIQWTQDGRRLFVVDAKGETVSLIDPSSGRREPWKALSRAEPGFFLHRLVIARNGKSYVLAFRRYSSNLFVLDGIH